jgi:methionyl-tRNA formyltransferase
VRVTLVTHDSIFSRYLATQLASAGALDRLIVERRSAPPRFYWRKLKRVGIANAVFQVWLNRQIRQSAARALTDAPMPAHESVLSVNECTFSDDELVIGFGTSIVSASTLARAPHGILNLHTGWLPDYRGVKSEFWALARGDREKIGWTLHYMTPRLDDGDVVLRHAVAARGADVGQVRAQLVSDAARRIADFVGTIRRDGFAAIPRRAQGTGEYFTTPTLRDWRELKRRVGASSP